MGDGFQSGFRNATLIYEAAPGIAESTAGAIGNVNGLFVSADGSQLEHLALTGPGMGSGSPSGTPRTFTAGRMLSPSGEQWTFFQNPTSKNIELKGPDPSAAAKWTEQFYMGHGLGGAVKIADGFLYDAATGEKKHAHRLPIINRTVALRTDGKTAFGVTKTEVVMIDLDTWQIKAAWPNPHIITDELALMFVGNRDKVVALALSPDGTILASAGQDRIIRLWDAATQRELACWTGHGAEITALRFFPDGKTLASGR